MFDTDQFKALTDSFYSTTDQAKRLYLDMAKTALSQIKLLIPNLIHIRWSNESETGDEGQTYTYVNDIVLELTPDDTRVSKNWDIRNVELLQEIDFTDVWHWDDIAEAVNDALEANPNITELETDALAVSLIQQRYAVTGIQTKQSLKQLGELLDWLIVALQKIEQDCEMLPIEMVESLASPSSSPVALDLQAV